MKKIYCDIHKCLNCRRCEFACYIKNAGVNNVFEAVKAGTAPVKNIDLLRIGEESFPFNCRQCDEPFCVEACISGALFINESNGRISFNIDKCVGCWSCIMKCPYGSVKMLKGKASRCDLCSGREIPECVNACPTRALVIE